MFFPAMQKWVAMLLGRATKAKVGVRRENIK